MAESPSSSIDLIARIAIPLLAFLGGMYVQYAIASRTLTQQEFTTATAIATSDAAQKNDKLREWANLVIAQYVAGKKQTQLARPLIPVDPSQDIFLVSRVIADKVCLFPKEGFLEPRASIVDTIDNHPEQAKGMDARIVAVKAISDYRILRLQYEAVQGILKDSCGFLLKR